MSEPMPYTLELLGCTGFSLTGDETAAFLMSNDPGSDFQRWMIRTVFQPADRLAGFVFVNVATDKPLKFMGANKHLGMGARGDLDARVLWQLSILEILNQGPFWQITAFTDSSQAVDAYGPDGCRDGAVVQSHDRNQTNRQLWALRPSAVTPG
ncbi:MAG TPA: hypothetical protein VJ851_09415 [Jatrophihabitans sp.]|nr:hypothetical protein [Jatrophihabitans sp.]